jgi:hypothetical protein
MKQTGVCLFMLLALLLAGCEALFQGKISMQDGKIGSLAELFIRAVEDDSRLSPPVQVYVENGQSIQNIGLSWSPVSRASSYRIERAVIEPVFDGDLNPVYRTPDESDFETLNAFVYGTTYWDLIIPTPQQNSPEYQNRYWYRISAENIAKKLEASEFTPPRMGSLFPPPRNVIASLGESEDYIEVRWDKVPTAASYAIYRSDYTNGASPYWVGRVPGNQNWYRQTNLTAQEKGVEYYYSVKGETAAGTQSLEGNLAMGYSLVPGAPPAVQNVQIPSGEGRGDSITSIKIKWDNNKDTDYYAVYRISSLPGASQIPVTLNTAATEWVDTFNLEPGVYYYYQIQPIKLDADNNKPLKGPFSPPNSERKTVEAFLLSPPSGITALKSPDGTSVSLFWYPAIGNDAERNLYSYAVYGSNAQNGPYTDLAASVAAPAGLNNDGYVSVGGAQVFTYYVVKTTKGGVTSAPSLIVSPAPLAAEIIDASKAAFLSGQNPNSSGIYPVEISWKKPANDNPAAYYVYRSSTPPDPENPKLGFSRISDSPVSASQADNQGVFRYYDKNDSAKTGRRYFYRVLSLNSLNQGYYDSETKIGWGALTHENFFLEYNKTVKNSHRKLTKMHQKDLSANGDESAGGSISGQVAYHADVGLGGGDITMTYSSYADYYIESNSTLGPYFTVSGNSNTHIDSATSQNGSMNGTMSASGMYPGTVNYGGIAIKGGSAGGGTYGVQPAGFPLKNISYSYGE